MRLTTKRLKQLVREELERINEADNHQNEIEAITNKIDLGPGKEEVAAVIASQDLRPTEKIQQVMRLVKKYAGLSSSREMNALEELYDSYMGK